MGEPIIEGEAVEVGAEIVPAAAPPVSLFRTDDPVEVLEKAKAIADALAPVIRAAGLVSNIQGRDYLNVEAWQTLGQQLGVTGVVVATRKIENGWEARCEARTLDGRTIGAADSMCTRNEVVKGQEHWKTANEFEIRSMAQTRAMSRALASVLRFIPTLAGMGGTPAEEMQNVGSKSGSGPRKPSQKQRDLFERLAKESGFQGDGFSQLMAWAESELTGGRDGSMSKAIDGLMDKDKRPETEERLRTAVEEWAVQQSDMPAPDMGGLEPEAFPEDEEIVF